MNDDVDDKIPFRFYPFKCPNCKGYGTVSYGKATCRPCKGKGIVVIDQVTGLQVYDDDDEPTKERANTTA
ncbi:MAG: hypothetical protein FMNOHCHN_03845 [Ignavibacteriaceae bacterium]|nr:hypothetical protein [Ignavibacteriaceae bacterium]